MQYISSSKRIWGFFDPAGNYNSRISWKEQWYVKGHNYIYQLVGIIICILIISSLFIFKKYYKKTIYLKWFRISIGIYQIISYFIYYIIMIFYLKIVLKENWINNINSPSCISGLSEIIPLHLSSIQQLLSRNYFNYS